MTGFRFPLPGERVNGRTVLASVWQNDLPDDGPMSAIIVALLPRLTPDSDFDYEVAEVGEDDGYVILGEHHNLVDAINGTTEEVGFVDMGGDR